MPALTHLAPGRTPQGAKWTLVAGGAAAAVVLIAFVGLARVEWSEQLDRLTERNVLSARLLADGVSRSVESVSQASNTLGELLQRGVAPEGPELQAALTQTLVNLGFLRGLAVLDAQGLVLGSTVQAEKGRVIDTARLGPLPPAGQEHMGQLVQGRMLLDLATGQTANPVPTGAGYLPLVRCLTLVSGQRLYLVALLNADAFANQQEATLNDERFAAALLSQAGQLLAATANVLPTAGADLSDLTPFTRFLPQFERGVWIGPGLRDGTQVSAFRATANRPLVVMVEFGLHEARMEWWSRMQGPMAAAGAALLLIGWMTRVARRSLQARERARLALDAAQAEVALRERELRVTIQSLQELIFRTDSQGRITYVNHAWLAVGQSALGLHLAALVQPDCGEAVEALFDPDRALASRRLQATLKSQGGAALRVVEISVMPLWEAAELIGFAGSAVDVTDQVRARLEIQAAVAATLAARDAAEASSRAKSEFIANISHELRTPLQSIIGFSELGMHRCAEKRLTMMFGEIHAGGQRMLTLVNDLLDVAKIEGTAGAVDQLERTDLRDLLQAVVIETEPLQTQRGMQIRLRVPSDPLIADVDRGRMAQVLRNLVANALKFAPAGSSIELRAEVQPNGDRILSVRDWGPGVPTGELESIFEPFVQSSRTKDGSGGTGLGLAICRKIVTAHGGRIFAANAEPTGAIFTVVLPLRERAARPVSQASIA